MRVEKLHYYSKVSNADCAEMEGRRLVGTQSGACAYSEQQSYFPIRPEDITLVTPYYPLFLNDFCSEFYSQLSNFVSG